MSKEEYSELSIAELSIEEHREFKKFCVEAISPFYLSFIAPFLLREQSLQAEISRLERCILGAEKNLPKWKERLIYLKEELSHV